MGSVCRALLALVCWSALKIHISEECYNRLERCALHSHGYIMSLRGEVDIKVVYDFYGAFS